MGNRTTIPAGHGKAVRLNAGQRVQLINTHGTQVVDAWALNAYDLREYMCMASTRAINVRLNPKVGDVLITNQRRPILTITEDTTPGIHDTVMAACDRFRYALLGVKGYHRNCQDNMMEGLQELGVTAPFPLPNSFNVFMNIPVQQDRNELDFRPTVCNPGDSITFRAEMDCYVVWSACPQDILPIHGEGGASPRDAHFEVLD
jgi:uncharacterized protein